ncbi:dihydrolipoyl dehydrogenase family protein [Saccharomonospora saliphila]|uniref:dihydrolipoyl dehydrogenase family protein n=1 Tax=Saccharomonospora saliphila TaxID=369829 RepID=UPI00036A525C|nr:NAD(P)/FAD-dependent oxidoreductase [Saccharomonospora saliphila]
MARSGETPRNGADADVIVLGGGAVGENAAHRAVLGGLSAVLVEHDLLGGECSYWACMPSKALLRPGNLLAAVRRMPGVAAPESLDREAVLALRDSFAAHWDDSAQFDWAQGAGVRVLRGTARLTGPRELTLADGTVLRAAHAVVICTGSVPVRPPIDGLAEAPVWTSHEATSAQTAPGSLAVLGDGAVGVEMAQVWARFGVEVELISTSDRVLPKLPPFVGEHVERGLRDDGVRVHHDSRAVRVATEDGRMCVELDGGGVVRADELLLATGRRPRTDDIGLEAVGLRPGEELTVDDSGLVRGVDGEWLYAAGDVTGRVLLTHQGKYAARVVGDAVAARARGERVEPVPWSGYAATADHHAVPQVVFTDPEVASVGLTEATDHRHRVLDLDLAVAGASLQAQGYSGAVRVVVDTEREVVLGAVLVGQDVAEMLHAATVAVVGEVPMRRLWHAVPAFPTMSEIWLRVLEEYGL